MPGIKDSRRAIRAVWEVTSVLQNVICFVGPTFHLFDKSSPFFSAACSMDFQPPPRMVLVATGKALGL